MLIRCLHILKMVKNVMIAKFELAFTRYQLILKTVENSTVTNSVQSFQELMPKKCTYTVRTVSVILKVLTNVLFSSLFCVFTRWHFQIVPFKSSFFKITQQKNVMFLCEHQIIPRLSHKSLQAFITFVNIFKVSWHRLNAV